MNSPKKKIPVVSMKALEHHHIMDDFPELATEEFNQHLFRFISERTGLSQQAKFNLDGMLDVSLNVEKVVLICLPFLYTLSRPQARPTSGDNPPEYDRWKILDQALSKQSYVLIYFRDNLECLLNQAFEQAVNMAIHRQGDFGLPSAKVRDWLSKKYKIRLPRGRKPFPDKRNIREKLEKTYSNFIKILAPGFNGRESRIGVCLKAVRKYKSKLGLRYDMHVEKMAEKVYDRKKLERAAGLLTAELNQMSERQVRRYLFGK